MNDPLSPHAELYLERWQPASGWARTVQLALETLMRDARDTSGWAKLAMMLGDAGAAPLCLLVCEHALGLDPSPSQDAQLRGHRGLCWLDFGLSRSSSGQPIPIRSLHRVEPDETKRREWLARQLEPFDGDLEAAAWFALRLAAVRLGLLAGPDPPSFDDLLHPSRWRRT